MLTVRSAAKAPPAFRYGLRWPSATSCKIPFVQLERDAATDEFLEKAVSANRLSWLRTRLHRVLRRFRSDFDVNGLLDACAPTPHPTHPPAHPPHPTPPDWPGRCRPAPPALDAAAIGAAGRGRRTAAL